MINAVVKRIVSFFVLENYIYQINSCDCFYKKTVTKPLRRYAAKSAASMNMRTWTRTRNTPVGLTLMKMLTMIWCQQVISLVSSKGDEYQLYE